MAHGYLQLADDRRVIPPVLQLDDGTTIDSFSLAVVRRVAPQALEANGLTGPMAQKSESLKYASFVPSDRIPTVTTSELFHASPQVANAAREKLREKVVLLGANWHSRSLEARPLIDSHPSPVGLLPGVMLHANYVESILQSEIVTPTAMWAATIAEWILTALVAFLLFAKIGWRAKFAWFAGIVAAYPLMSFFGMRLLGVYTDVLLLTLALVLHLVADVPTRMIHLTLKVKELESRLARHRAKGH